MKTFKDLQFHPMHPDDQWAKLKEITPEYAKHRRYQAVEHFENGYVVSVVSDPPLFEPDGAEGLWELAVCVSNPADPEQWVLCYDTPITQDVERKLEDAEVTALMERVQALPPDPEAFERALQRQRELSISLQEMAKKRVLQ